MSAEILSQRGALLSACGLYRYRLWRVWNDDLPLLAFVMLNPSTADADVDDPTIRKCIGFATRLGFGGIVVVNLFAFRTAYPDELRGAHYPVGPENDEHLRWAAGLGTVVCAWGSNARKLERPCVVLAELRRLGVTPMALRVNTDGTPAHPLMLSYEHTLRAIA